MTSRDAWLSGGSRMPVPGTSHTLFVRQDGPADGRPVTLLHGFPTSSHDWAEVLDEAPAVGHYPQVEALELVGPLLAGFVS